LKGLPETNANLFSLFDSEDEKEFYNIGYRCQWYFNFFALPLTPVADVIKLSFFVTVKK
jgi:hypothetical protein